MSTNLGSGSAIRVNRMSLAFTGAANLGQAGTAATLFTVTGRIYVHSLTAFCTEAIATTTTGSISLGTASQVTRFVGVTAAVAGDHPLDLNEWWVTTTPTVGSIDLPDAMQSVLVAENIIVDCTVSDITDGTIAFVLKWEPESTDGAVS